MSSTPPVDSYSAAKRSFEQRSNNEYINKLRTQNPDSQFVTDMKNEAIQSQKARWALNQTNRALNRSWLAATVGLGAVVAFAYYYPRMSRPKHETLHGAEELMGSTREQLHKIQQSSRELRQSLERPPMPDRP